LIQKRPFLDMPERRLRTVIIAIAETLEPGERIDLDVKNPEKKALSRWDDEGGAGGWS
jgi:phosphoribosyl-dephospho-CoA transferase